MRDPEETCNHVDDDCDGLVDEDLQGWIGDPVQLTEDEIDQWTPVVAWTGTELAVGWTVEEFEGGPGSVQIGTLGLDGQAAGALTEVAQTDTVPETTALALIGELALFAYGLEPVDRQAEPVVALTPLGGGGEPVPVPLAPVGDLYASSHFEVFATPGDGMLVSMVTPFSPPNELRVATWSLDPIGETHSLALPDLYLADAVVTPSGDLLVAWTTAGEMFVGRYDAALEEVEAPRAVTATGGQVPGGQIVAIGESALLLYGTTDDNDLHALPLGEDLTSGAVIDDLGFAGVANSVSSSSSGTEVLVMSGDPATKTGWITRLGPDGTPHDPPAELPPGRDFMMLRSTWAGDRWAFVWVDDPTVRYAFDVFLHTYGCL